ncbi:unnamed protein product [Brassica rapa subsp. trilocularis]|uniref:(rape) hypothetical protein n=1 Tax=Brassica napus TaxID=3708 RepID=A0A817AKD9_BRANA|nr:unnamed protein product [Brassica napus]
MQSLYFLSQNFDYKNIFVLPHPLIKHWIFVLRNDQTHSPIFKCQILAHVKQVVKVDFGRNISGLFRHTL